MSGDFPTHFGKLYRDLHSLEFLMRMRLYKNEITDLPNSQEKEGEGMKELENAKVGDVVTDNWLTKHASFSEVMKEYKRAFNDNNLNIERLRNIRNAMSHAMFFTNDPQHPMTCINVTQMDGELVVTFKQSLTEEWYNEQLKFLGDVIKEVGKQA